MIKRTKILIEQKDGTIKKRSISKKSLSNYDKEKRAPYKGYVYVKKEINYRSSKTYRLKQNNALRKSYTALKRSDANTVDIDRIVSSTKRFAEKQKYARGYMKTEIIATNLDGEKQRIAVVSKIYSKTTMNDMLNDFRDEYKKKLEKIEQSPQLQGYTKNVRITKIVFVTVPSGNGIHRA